MALTIVRNDIVKMEVDAIVNSTNEHLMPGGYGVDASIHTAAGFRLKKALRKIGYCPIGEAVVTEAFDIPSCKYIIHTAGPVYEGGNHGEAELLKSCYQNILRLARSKGCRSLAIPSISSGACEYPKEEAYRIATSTIREFLYSLPEDEDMMIYLVLFDQKSVNYSDRIDGKVASFIQDTYPKAKKEQLFYGRADNRASTARPMAAEGWHEEVFETTMAFPAVALSPEKEKSYEDQDLSFAEMCEWWCEKKGISKKQFYISSNINRSMFWNMKHHPEQIPKKTNVLACVIGLRLDYEEAQDLLMRAGMTLSPYYALDREVGAFLKEGNYNIDEINEVLFEKDMALLGAF